MIGTKFNKQAASTAPNRIRLPTVNCLHEVQVVRSSNPLDLWNVLRLHLG